MTTTDPKILDTVSPKFTVDTLKQILIRGTGENDVSVDSWNVEPACAKGDNYLSVVHRVTIQGKVNGKNVTYKAIVKALPTNKIRNVIFRSKDFFNNETAFYSKIIALYEDFLRSKGRLDLLNVPRCLAYLQDGKNDFIVLEDAKEKGFEGIDRLKAWKLEDCQLIFGALAQYHGVGLAVWNQKPKEFEEAASHMSEPFFHSKFWDWYGRYYASTNHVVRDALTNEYPDSPQAKKFCSITPKQLYDKCVELVERKGNPIKTVCHGDSWTTNFMSRTLPNGQQEGIIFDFQLARCASPVHDLGYFITTCTDKETRDNHLESSLKHYHDVLSKTVAALGSNIENLYPYDVFMKEVKEQIVMGIAFGLETLPMSLLSADESFDLDQAKEGETINIADIWKPVPTKDPENRKRIADMVKFAVDQGYFDCFF